MYVTPIHTPIITPDDDVLSILENFLPKKGEEGMIVVISAKIIAIMQKRVKHLPFEDLVKNESEEILSAHVPGMWIGKKYNILIPNAGIDASNAPNGGYVLWPKDPFLVAEEIQKFLLEKYSLSRVGVVISDSRITPQRRGTVGVAVAWSGFEGVEDRRGEKDLFGRVLQISTVNMADNLASTAEVLMGQGGEGVPIVLIFSAPVRWTDEKQTSEKYFIPENEDLFPPFLKNV